MSAHTPGPWTTETKVRVDLQLMPQILFCDPRELKGPEQANARLIAAAPALLSALLNLEQAYRHKHSPQHRLAARMEAIGAIAKAEGK